MNANGSDSKNDSIIKELKDFLKVVAIKEGAEYLMNKVPELIENAKKRVSKLKEASNDSVLQLLKMAWNFEEKFQENYGLEDAIRWFKDNDPGEKYLACIFLKTNKIENKSLPNITSLHHCFIEIETRKPVFDGTVPYKLLKTLNLNADLKDAFGDKVMIILK